MLESLDRVDAGIIEKYYLSLISEKLSQTFFHTNNL